jgi:UDP-2,3-diacylglucosamine hydrolase
MTQVQLPPNKKIYFLSDFHLGAPDHERSLEREKTVVEFLEKARTMLLKFLL